MMPIAPTFPTADLARIDRESRLAAIEKAKNRIVHAIYKQIEELPTDYGMIDINRVLEAINAE